MRAHLRRIEGRGARTRVAAAAAAIQRRRRRLCESCSSSCPCRSHTGLLRPLLTAPPLPPTCRRRRRSVYTKGRAVATGQDLTVALNALHKSAFAKENVGWNYGVNAAALLGEADTAMAQVLARASVAPADGYRFPAFAPHYQDFDPSRFVF